uniref:G_PROTEIN_RECEP_F1_2 domain-containing protein n=1 Tax=Onchocerca volvulus TaxID=6282 RepID=A0A8R1TMH9_ONCVO
MAENTDYEDNIALACISTVSICGLISNGLALYMTRKMSHFRNAFGILCSSFLICNFQGIFVLFTWSTIVITIKSPLLSSPELFLVRLIGVFVNGGWFGALFVHFFIALNRLCAIAYPMKYKKLWSEAKALVTGIFSWILGMTICMIHLFKDCSLLFDGESYDFNYQDSFYGNICSYSDTGLTLIMVIAKTFLDVLTLIKILAYRKTMPGKSAISSGARNEREILFFKQSCLLNFIFFICLAILDGHEFLITDKWLTFAASTITWIMMQSLDGLIFLIFNLKVFWKTIWMVSVAPVTYYGHHIVTRF